MHWNSCDLRSQATQGPISTGVGGLPWQPFGCCQLLYKSRRSPCCRSLSRDRTSHEKGLRDRISPICTLSQNGYGATHGHDGYARSRWATTLLQPRLQLRPMWEHFTSLLLVHVSRYIYKNDDKQRAEYYPHAFRL